MSTRPAEIRKIKPHRVKKTFYETIEPWLFLLPALCVFGVFLYFPFFKTLYLSTFLTNKFGQAKIFYGLKNYADILYGKYSREFWNSIWVTVRFVFFVAGGGLLVGLCTSLITVNKFPGKALASAIYAMPIAIASSAAAMSFKMILHKSIGLLNHLLGTSINWLSDTTWTFPIICILSIWLASGINFIFIGAGLRNIPEELYESAAIDGAGYWKKLHHPALPEPHAVFPDHRQYHQRLPVLHAGKAAHLGRPAGENQPDRILHLSGCVPQFPLRHSRGALHCAVRDHHGYYPAAIQH